jgi:formylglycine-generating enzyme required for sulfatase activity
MSQFTLQRQQRRVQSFTEDLGNGIDMDLILVPGGGFEMGQTEVEKAELIRQVGETDYQNYYARELPRHSVTVPPFFMGRYPVTQAQWQEIATLPPIKQNLKENPSSFKGKNRPVEQVSWFDAVEFCDRLSHKTGKTYRLPTEAQWEYACRAGTTTPFHTGETITTDLANYNRTYTYGRGVKGERRGVTTDVGRFPPNAFGLCDMHGNVWEWCLDHWHERYEGAPTDGSAWLTDDQDARRMRRGGSWFCNPRYCRSACRFRSLPDLRDYGLGFRVVCVLPRTL